MCCEISRKSAIFIDQIARITVNIRRIYLELTTIVHDVVLAIDNADRAHVREYAGDFGVLAFNEMVNFRTVTAPMRFFLKTRAVRETFFRDLSIKRS